MRSRGVEGMWGFMLKGRRVGFWREEGRRKGTRQTAAKSPQSFPDHSILVRLDVRDGNREKSITSRKFYAPISSVTLVEQTGQILFSLIKYQLAASDRQARRLTSFQPSDAEPRPELLHMCGPMP